MAFNLKQGLKSGLSIFDLSNTFTDPQRQANQSYADQSNFQSDINQIRLLRNTQPTSTPTSASPSATSPARSTYVNNLAGQQSQPGSSLGAYRYDDSPTVYGNYQGNPDFAFSSAEQFQGAGGNFGNVEVRQRPTAAGTTGTAATTDTAATTKKTPAKSAYLSYLESFFDPEALKTTASSLGELNKRTSEELLRAREEEDVIRKNEIGQLESGQRFNLSESARLSNKSLADLALSKGYQTDIYNQMLGAGKELYDLQQNQYEPTSVSAGETLVQFNPETGEYESVYQAPAAAGDPYKGLPSSAQEYLFALQQGYQGSYEDYQNDDANRKRSVVNVSTGGFTPYQQFGAINTIQDNARQDKDISLFPDVRGAYEQGIQAAKQRNSLGDIVLMRTIAKITDPASAVREEEFATFQGAAGTLPRYGVLLTSNMVGKGQLTQAGRDAIVQQLQNIYNQREAAYQSKINYYNQQAAPFGGSVPSYSAPSSNDPLGLGL